MQRVATFSLVLVIIVSLSSPATHFGWAQTQSRLEGHHIIVISSQLGLINNPQAWIGKLDLAYEAMKELTAGDIRTLALPDGKITLLEDPSVKGAAYAGNPIRIDPGLFRALMVDSWNAHSDPGFGFVHELGHDFHADFPCFQLTGGDSRVQEAFANLMLCYAYEKLQPPMILLNGELRTIWGLEDNFYIARANQYISGVKSFENIKRNDDALVGLLLILKNQYGWRIFREAFAAHRSLSPAQIPSTDSDKAQLFVSILSKAAGKDLSSTFREWGFPVQRVPTPYSVYLFIQVVDDRTGVAIQGASVYWDGNYVGMTGPDGKLRIDTAYPPEVHHNKVTKSGYNDDDGDVSIGPTSGSTFTVKMVPSATPIPFVVALALIIVALGGLRYRSLARLFARRRVVQTAFSACCPRA